MNLHCTSIIGGPSRTYAVRADRCALRSLAVVALVALTLFGAGCTTLPPGLDAPKPATTALANPDTTTLGKRAAAQAKQHANLSGFRLLVDGTDSFALHIAIANGAERTLDVQYFLFKQDDTGKLLLEAMLRAADRGVRVRLLLDDAEAFDKGSAIRPLAAHPNVDIRIFNPFVTRREFSMFRFAEFAVGSRRLNYRMHNKLFVGDNAVAVTGGRNIGDAYFQASTELELGDFDLAVVGPMVRELSKTFDLYWNDRLAVPVEYLPLGKPSATDLETCRKDLTGHKEQMKTAEYTRTLPKRDLMADLLSGKVPLVWAKATLAYDTPEKLKVEQGEESGKLMWKRVEAAVDGTQRDLIVVSPYLVLGEEELALIRRLRERSVRIRILTNSLASTDMPIAHVGYMRSRVPLLEAGCELYEVRPQIGKPETGHGMIKSGSSGQFALHAKVFVIDNQRAFVGSMNFDQRSLDINTEIGIIIDSPQISREIASRFEAIAQPANSYKLVLVEGVGGFRTLQWTTEVSGKELAFTSEPDVEAGRLSLIHALSLLPIDNLL